jgi:hypothetical protein
MRSMNKPLATSESSRRVIVAVLAIAASSLAWGGGPPGSLPAPRNASVVLAQNTAPGRAPSPAVPVAAAQPSGVLAWTFDAAQPGAGAGWTAERGTLTPGSGEARLQPDRNRHVVLVSPPSLPDAARDADAFVLGLSGTGLERVRIQARRDARGGWITIADASGDALRQSADGYVIKRSAAARGAPIERLRIDLAFRTTNARSLTRIAINPAPR